MVNHSKQVMVNHSKQVMVNKATDKRRLVMDNRLAMVNKRATDMVNMLVTDNNNNHINNMDNHNINNNNNPAMARHNNPINRADMVDTANNNKTMASKGKPMVVNKVGTDRVTVNPLVMVNNQAMVNKDTEQEAKFLLPTLEPKWGYLINHRTRTPMYKVAFFC